MVLDAGLAREASLGDSTTFDVSVSAVVCCFRLALGGGGVGLAGVEEAALSLAALSLCSPVWIINECK